jgi:hypothetical protein
VKSLLPPTTALSNTVTIRDASAILFIRRVIGSNSAILSAARTTEEGQIIGWRREHPSDQKDHFCQQDESFSVTSSDLITSVLDTQATHHAQKTVNKGMRSEGFLFLGLALLCVSSCAGQRNAEAEALCQPFLTSTQTSPILASKRNIRIDEDGEFHCELVLQDR